MKELLFVPHWARCVQLFSSGSLTSEKVGAVKAHHLLRLYSWKPWEDFSKSLPDDKKMKVLNVAEKNDAAKNVADLLSGGRFRKRDSLSKYNKIYEFDYTIGVKKCHMLMTSVSGHLLNYDFIGSYRKWTDCHPEALFDAPVQKMCLTGHEATKSSLEKEARSSHVLVIWTDCDREGENIGFEVVKVCTAVNPSLEIYRAKFSEITRQSVTRAIQNLVEPDKRVSEAVDVRQELDLRIGAAFTRFQTLRLSKVFPDVLSNTLISYGSCQFPTLGFVVERYKAIQQFKVEGFWKIEVEYRQGDDLVQFHWKRVRLFNKLACQVLLDDCKEHPLATVEDVQSKPKSKRRPVALDTVELEKLASRKLRLSAKETMQIAERLYTQGFISYPRTETNIFPKELNLVPLVEMQADDPNWGEFSRRVLLNGPNPHNGKKSDQAHPPIHPTKYTNSLTGNDRRVYEFVVRHFLACCSADAQGKETVVDIDINDEKFVASGLTIYERNYLEVYPYDKWVEKTIPNFEKGQSFYPARLEMVEGETSPPPLLTEADLIALMDKHGIGTDATHADHIETIKNRMYVGLIEQKHFVPGQLGMGLVEGYDSMGFEMSKPRLRANLEADLKRICEGSKDPKAVLREQIKEYKTVFVKAAEQVLKLDDAVGRNLGEERREVRQEDLEIAVPPKPLKCPRCNADMALKRRKNNAWYLSCMAFPQCKTAVWFPESVLEIKVDISTCSACKHRPPFFTFTFQKGAFAPFYPDKFAACICGCDPLFLNVLGITWPTAKQGFVSQLPINNEHMPTGDENLVPPSVQRNMRRGAIDNFVLRNPPGSATERGTAAAASREADDERTAGSVRGTRIRVAQRGRSTHVDASRTNGTAGPGNGGQGLAKGLGTGTTSRGAVPPGRRGGRFSGGNSMNMTASSMKGDASEGAMPNRGGGFSDTTSTPAPSGSRRVADASDSNRGGHSGFTCGRGVGFDGAVPSDDRGGGGCSGKILTSACAGQSNRRRGASVNAPLGNFMKAVGSGTDRGGADDDESEPPTGRRGHVGGNSVNTAEGPGTGKKGLGPGAYYRYSGGKIICAPGPDANASAGTPLPKRGGGEGDTDENSEISAEPGTGRGPTALNREGRMDRNSTEVFRTERCASDASNVDPPPPDRRGGSYDDNFISSPGCSTQGNTGMFSLDSEVKEAIANFLNATGPDFEIDAGARNFTNTRRGPDPSIITPLANRGPYIGGKFMHTPSPGRGASSYASIPNRGRYYLAGGTFTSTAETGTGQSGRICDKQLSRACAAGKSAGEELIDGLGANGTIDIEKLPLPPPPPPKRTKRSSCTSGIAKITSYFMPLSRAGIVTGEPARPRGSNAGSSASSTFEPSQPPARPTGTAGGAPTAPRTWRGGNDSTSSLRLPAAAAAEAGPSALAVGRNESPRQKSPEKEPQKIKCLCNVDAVLLHVRKNGPNYGRPFYKCSQYPARCDFFMWGDEPPPVSGLRHRELYQSPGTSKQPPKATSGRVERIICHCGDLARKCTVTKESYNKGRNFYSCPHPFGMKCNFFDWAELSRNASAASHTRETERAANENDENTEAHAKKKRKCGLCGETGHNRKNCPHKTDE